MKRQSSATAFVGDMENRWGASFFSTARPKFPSSELLIAAPRLSRNEVGIEPANVCVRGVVRNCFTCLKTTFLLY